METEMNLLEEVTALLLKQIEGKARTSYQLNLVTHINLSTCRQVLNGSWNPNFRTLLELKEKYAQ